ncbi:MAG: hypothetical protein ACTSYU_05595, partial [Promethearchaeota archaeon]
STQWVDIPLYDLTDPNADPIMVDAAGQISFDIPANDYVILAPVDLRPQLEFAPFITDDSNPITDPQIQPSYIRWDKRFNGDWGYPLYFDLIDDTAGRPEDLSYLYLVNDHQNLYVGFPYRENTWTSGGNIEFGLAISTQEGGTNWGPGFHSQLNYAGDVLPEYLLYAISDVDDQPSNEIQNATLYRYDDNDENWSISWELSPEIDFKSDSMYRFAMIRIPFSAIQVEDGDDVSVMLFSTQEGKTGAADSVPHDTTTDAYGDAETWLSLPDPLEITIPPEPEEPNDTTTNTTDTTSTTISDENGTDDATDDATDDGSGSDNISGFQGVFLGIGILAGVWQISKKTNKK